MDFSIFNTKLLAPNVARLTPPDPFALMAKPLAISCRSSYCAKPTDYPLTAERVELEVNTDGIRITINEKDDSDASLEDLADQLEMASSLTTKTYSATKRSTKGSEVVISIGISLAALKAAYHIIAPILITWLNRPRKQAIEITYSDGSVERNIVIAAESQGSKEFVDGLSVLAQLLSPLHQDGPDRDDESD